MATPDKFKMLSHGQKFRIKKADIVFLLLLASAGGMYYYTGKYFFMVLTVSLGILYLPILILKLIFHWGRTKEMTMEQALRKVKHYDTSDWRKSKAMITQILPGDIITENGKAVAKMTSFKVWLENYGENPMINEAFISDVIMPITHFQSFAINTQVDVLVKPTRITAIFDPENENWHYEMKN
jgi:hypothetical protein